MEVASGVRFETKLPGMAALSTPAAAESNNSTLGRNKSMSDRFLTPVASVALLCFLGLAGRGGEGRVKVTIQDEKPVVVETILPVDPTPRIRFTAGALTAMIRTEQNQSLHLSNTTILKIDDQVMQVGAGGGRFV